jgi:subtilisin family serine protease
MKQTASLILMFGLCAAASAESFEYHYFKTPITLVPIGTRLAVHSTSLQSSDQLSASFEKASLELSHIEAMPIAGWSLATTIQPAADQQDLRNRISQWLASNDNGYVSPVFLGNDGGQVMIAPQILIGFDPDVDPQQIVTLIQDECGSGSIIELLDASQRLYKVELPAVRSGLTVLEHANALAMRDLVHMSEPDMIFTGTSGGLIPNDTGFGNCWGLHNTGQSGGTVDADMDAPEAWDVTTGDPNIIVVVLDTGVDTSHPDLNWIPGIDTTSDGGDGNPVNSLDNHGTPVAGCVAAIINNASGTVGVSPTCKVASARTFITTTSGGNWISSSSWTVNSLIWARTIGARVTNNSNGYGFTSSSIASTYQSLRDVDGIVHFASAGNNAANQLTYPSSLSSVNAVSALHRSGFLASFSNFNNALSYSAPGDAIYTTDRTGSAGWGGGNWVNAWGTSFASPYAAGVAALALSVNPDLTAAQAEAVLAYAAEDYGAPGFDSQYGEGFINAGHTVVVADLFRIDLNIDADITIADFDELQANIDTLPAPNPDSDFNQDGNTDMIDFAWFQYAYAKLKSYE